MREITHSDTCKVFPATEFLHQEINGGTSLLLLLPVKVPPLYHFEERSKNTGKCFGDTRRKPTRAPPLTW